MAPEPVNIAALMVVLPDGTVVPIRDLRVVIGHGQMVAPDPPAVAVESPEDHGIRVADHLAQLKKTVDPTPVDRGGVGST